MRRFFESTAGKWVLVALELIAIGLTVFAVIWLLQATGLSEQEYESAYVLCMKGDYVNVRMGPSRKSASVGWADSGQEVYLDGRQKNGYVHVDGLTEYGSGWIHAGYVVRDEPEYVNRTATIVARGRVAARKYVGGKRTRWLKSGADLRVYWWSEEWCLTNCGYVRTEYLELDGE